VVGTGVVVAVVLVGVDVPVGPDGVSGRESCRPFTVGVTFKSSRVASTMAVTVAMTAAVPMISHNK
jgi:hypothetical protein